MNWGGTTWQFRTHAGLNPACLCCCAEEEPPEEKRGGRRKSKGKANWDNPFLGLTPSKKEQSQTLTGVNIPVGIEKAGAFVHNHASTTPSPRQPTGIGEPALNEGQSLPADRRGLSAIDSAVHPPAIVPEGDIDEDEAFLIWLISTLDDL